MTDAQHGQPLVSIVVCTKNGMPYVREAMGSLEQQTYRPFEVVVQDAQSSDGTREFLESLEFDRIDVVSEPDAGLGDAYSRAFLRCSGEIVATLDADNLIPSDALERAVAVLRDHPDAGALYGAVDLVDAGGASIGVFVPSAFELGPLMRCELVPPFSTGFFVRTVCGDELRCDPSLTMCADFDLWLRLSPHEIVRTEHVLGRTRHSAKSMTRTPSLYEQFTREKLAALERHFERHPELARERDEAVAGVYCWAAESLFELEGASERSRAMLERAALAAPRYRRVEKVRRRLDGSLPTPSASTGRFPRWSVQRTRLARLLRRRRRV